MFKTNELNTEICKKFHTKKGVTSIVLHYFTPLIFIKVSLLVINASLYSQLIS